MSRGRTTALRITLTCAEQQTLEQWLRKRTIPLGLARRGRLVLLVAQGTPIAAAARAVGISRRHAYIWLRRWQEAGLTGLQRRRQGGPL